jgi:hypothetical protein
MNASEQARTLDLTSKIASTVNLFKTHFPDAKADLKPWKDDYHTRNTVDPDSIDIGFHFPGWSPRLQSRSLLVQIRFYRDIISEELKLIGIEIIGFNHQGQAWRMSTVANWELEGATLPVPEIATRLKNFCRQVFELFNLKQNE